MLSKAEVAKGQGVASAYREQVSLIENINDFDVKINSKKDNFDIYHVHSVHPSYRARMNKRHINVVYVHFIPAKNHDSIKLPKLAQIIFDGYVNSFYRKADELVVVNPCFIKDLEELGIKRENITYIPNYVSQDNFNVLNKEEVDHIKDKYNIPKDKFIVLGCGQIQTRKGIDDFVATAEANPDMVFVWVGGFSFGRIMHGYRKYRKLFQNLPQNMVHIPILERKYMNEVFNMCDVLFMPSFMELFPMTILEIANVHKPFLLRDLDLYRPILFSRYAKGNSVEDFTNELKKLKDDATYYEQQVNNSIFVSDFYNKDVLSKTWKDYYQRIYLKWKSKKKIK